MTNHPPSPVLTVFFMQRPYYQISWFLKNNCYIEILHVDNICPYECRKAKVIGKRNTSILHIQNHGLKNNTRLTRFFNPTKKKERTMKSQAVRKWRSFCVVWLLAEMPPSRAVFDLNNQKPGVNRWIGKNLEWMSISKKKSEVCRVGCVLYLLDTSAKLEGNIEI